MKTLWIILLLMIVQGAMAETPPLILVKPEVAVIHQKVVSLKDISIFRNVPEKLVKEIGDIVLSDAPGFNEQRIFSNKTISEIFRSQLAKQKNSPRVQLRIPNQVVIKNRGYPLTDKEVSKKLEKQWEKLCKDCVFKIKNVTLPIVEEGLMSFPWELQSGSHLPKGSFVVGLTFKINDRHSQLFWVKGSVEVHKKVPVATRRLQMGERLQPDDVQMKVSDVTFALDGFIEADKLIGRRLTRSVRADEIIFSGYIEREKALRRGQIVKVSAQDSDWNVVINGVAENDAYIGDVITVRNPKTEKRISVKVIGQGEVVLQ